MALLKQIGHIEVLLEHSALAESYLWERDIAAISSTELVTFIARMKYAGREDEARSNVDTALQQITRAMRQGEIPVSPLAALKLPEKPIQLGDVRRMLSNFSLVRRKAILFSLEAGLTLEDTLLLKWKATRAADYAGLANQIIRSLPRHIGCDFVFWEYNRAGLGMPLFGLIQQFTDVTCGISWEKFQAAYKTALPYDYDLEKAAFMDAFNFD